MCRFVAYIGNEKVVLKQFLNDSTNSLIAQSRLARETRTGLNADGFGIGWYDHEVDETPALFKSVQPAWNDENLIHISSKVRSNCFMGHVRASTVGDVSISNCHPFSFQKLLFAHNGTFHHFRFIKRDLLKLLTEDHFLSIKGQTDSEHFFYLLCTQLTEQFPEWNHVAFAQVITQGIQTMNELLESKNLVYKHRSNCALTDGKSLVALRYTSDPHKVAHSLYYYRTNEAVVIASECLTDSPEEWKEVPPNAILSVTPQLELTIAPLRL